MLIIAEIGLNHNGDMNMAKCLIEEAKDAGADVAKFQFFDASKYFSPDFEWFEACMKARLSLDQASGLKKHCDNVGIEFLVSAFDVQGVEWAEKLGVKRHKIASRCIKQKDLVDAMCKTGKDIIVSLGMWDKPEFPEINTNAKVDFLYCVAKYPTMPKDLEFDKVDFRKYAGFSDHTIGINAACIAIARGAKIIEKHFTLSKKLYGPDHSGSMEVHELHQIVKRSKEYKKILDSKG